MEEVEELIGRMEGKRGKKRDGRFGEGFTEGLCRGLWEGSMRILECGACIISLDAWTEGPREGCVN